METFLTALALAMDSFALSVVSGSLNKRLSFLDILKMALIFGFFQAFMPFFGFIFGNFVIEYVLRLHRYVAFAILFVIGIKFVLDAKKANTKSIDLGIFSLLSAGFITSIDAFGVGIALGLEYFDIKKACFIIGTVCFVLCIAGAYLGKTIGKLFGDRALMIGGIILMGIGYKMLVSH